VIGEASGGSLETGGSAGAADESVRASKGPEATIVTLPPPSDGGVVPTVEWWDEAFLPKATRENRKKSRAAAEADDYPHASILYVKSHNYIQHPVSIRALGGDKPDVPLPMYLTKKERKRIRKTARQEREIEKRDKMMMGKCFYCVFSITIPY
jgi:hypothetical protein